MAYRTRTYIAGDWTNDKNAIDQLYKWNNSDYWGLDFVDAHQFHQSNDGSLNCSIKDSLRDRMDSCKTFVLVVGDKTNITTAGACSNCSFYVYGYCRRNNTTSDKSYIQFECDKAARDDLKIVVLYNSTVVSKSKCPESVRNIGTHIPMMVYVNGQLQWNYSTIKNAINN